MIKEDLIMDYLKIYKEIIRKARLRNSKIGEEKHHIIPKSIFSDKKSHILSEIPVHNRENKENVVNVTLREHYVLHILIAKISKTINKNCYERSLYAFNIMSSRTNSSRKFCKLTKQYLNNLSKNMMGKPSRAKGTTWSAEAKLRKSLNHPAKGKTYEEYHGIEKAKELKKLRSISSKGRIMSQEARKKISQRIITKECRDKISKSNTGKKRTKEQIQKMRDYANNRDKNHFVIQTRYKFYHKDGRELIARKIDMRKDYGCATIHNVIRGERNHSNGWYFKGEIYDQ